MDETLTLQFDGGSRGNPGPAGIGVVVSAQDGTNLVTLGRFIGRATNNVAEYRALITAMQEAEKLGAKKVLIRGDSELVIKQMRGEYRVKNPDMRVLFDEAKRVISRFTSANIEHNLRHKNELADKLANLAMDRRQDVTEVSGETSSAPAMAITPTGGGPPLQKGDELECSRCGVRLAVTRPPGSTPSFVKPFVCQCGAKLGPV